MPSEVPDWKLKALDLYELADAVVNKTGSLYYRSFVIPAKRREEEAKPVASLSNFSFRPPTTSS